MRLEDLLPIEKLRIDLSSQYRSAQPFPHIVIDDFLTKGSAERLERDFPKPDDLQWLKYKAKAEMGKLQSTSELLMPESIRDMIQALNSSLFVRFLERVTGISGIIPDPHLYGGGMHQTLRGGFLKIHIDYNRHESWNLDRRLNVLLYLNSGWDEKWGGALELWDADVKNCVQKIAPISNRLVIFGTTEYSWHGHPEPLACPAGVTRKSLALYYYSNGRPQEEIAMMHSTVFRERPGEHIGSSMRERVREFVPPIVVRWWRAARGRGTKGDEPGGGRG